MDFNQQSVCISGQGLISDALKCLFKNYGVPDDKIEIVKLSDISETVKKFQNNGATIKIIVVFTQEIHKQAHETLKQWKELKDSIADSQVTILTFDSETIKHIFQGCDFTILSLLCELSELLDNSNRQRTKKEENNMNNNNEADQMAKYILALHRFNGQNEFPSEQEIQGKFKDVSIRPDPNLMSNTLWHDFKNIFKRKKWYAKKKEMCDVWRKMLEWHRSEIDDNINQDSPYREIERLTQRPNDDNFVKIGKIAERYFNDEILDEEIAEDDKTKKESHPKKFDILLVDDSNIYSKQLKKKFKGLVKEHHKKYHEDYNIKIFSANPENAFDDALIKLHKNTQIKAVVVDWMLSSDTDKSGDYLIREIKTKWQGIYTCLLTGHPVLDVFKSNGKIDVRAFYKRDPYVEEEIFADIMQFIKICEKTPLFSALKDYAERPVTNLHALIAARGSSLKKSTWLREFYEFYGDHVFMAETSSAQAPLDSLLDPTGSIKAAQEMAAKVFGAAHTFFVTNGTSTANKIVHQAVLKPGDKVLLDRNCHKSHHYGLVLAGARPVYLKTEPLYFGNNDKNEFTGICKGVELEEEIVKQLKEHSDAKMLCLTNCTFDGYVHDAKRIIRAVWEELTKLQNSNNGATNPEDFVFLFDEAWFGHARFIPRLKQYTAMHAYECCCDDNIRPRVYATQSTHKTLTAFRQGSMIHINDPLFEEKKHAFEEAIYTHTTTSPSYNLVASLDAGRMQADMEGYKLCSEAWDYAEKLRGFINEDENVNKYFHLLTDNEMGASIPDDDGNADFFLDITKLTLFIKKEAGLTGDDLRKLLLSEYDIQLNKTTHNTILLILNAGITESSVGHLIGVLRKISRRIEREKPNPRTLKFEGDIFKKRVESFSDETGESAEKTQPIPLREAFYHLEPENTKPTSIKLKDLKKKLNSDPNTEIYSSRFIIPYPPGFPILVPGQRIDLKYIEYLEKLSGQEVHGMPESDKLLVVTK